MSAKPDDQAIAAFDRIEEHVRELPARWGTRAGELRSFGPRWVDAWNSHDLEGLDAMVTDDVTWEDPAMNGHLVHGRDEFRAFAETFFGAFPDARVEGVGAPYLAVDGCSIAVRSRMVGTFTGELTLWGTRSEPSLPSIAPTGRGFDIQGVDLYELREGLVARWTIVYDRIELAQQIGLS